MAGLSAPTADGSNDTQHEIHASLDAQAQLALGDDAYVPPERWLHSATVDELRLSRARAGLPVPRDWASVPRPPFTAPEDPIVSEGALDGIFAVRQESRLSELFAVVTETARRQATRAWALAVRGWNALTTFLNQRFPRDGARLSDM